MNIWLTFTWYSSILSIYNLLNISISLRLILMQTRYPFITGTQWHVFSSCIYSFLISYTCLSHRWFNPSHNPDNHFQHIFMILIVVMSFKTKIVLLVLRFAIYYSNLKENFSLYFLFSVLKILIDFS